MSEDPARQTQVRRYRRPLARPLLAALGSWSVREGIILRHRDPSTGICSFFEIAPLPPSVPSIESIPPIPSIPPAPASIRTAALLTLGSATRDEMHGLRNAGYRTYKLKVGVDEAAEEWEWLEAVVAGLRPGETIRLDPNRSWDEAVWNFWMPRLNEIAKWIEFVEEPFGGNTTPGEMLRHGESSPVPLALDESLAKGGLHDWLKRGWPGYWVVKPTLFGPSLDWMDALGRHHSKVVLSSVFETGIGLSNLIRLAQEFPETDHGFGTQAYFDDDLGVPQNGAEMTALDTNQQEELWRRLPTG